MSAILTKQRLIQFAKVLLGVGLVAVLINKGMIEVDKLKVLLNPQVILIGFLLVALNTLFLAWRWHVLLKFYKFATNFINALRFYLIGVFFNYALPGAVSGDLVKAFYISRTQPNQKMKAALSVLIDRVLGLYSMLLMSFFSSVFVFQNTSDNSSPLIKLIESSWIVLAIASLGLGALFSLPMSKLPVVRNIKKLKSLLDSLYELGRTPQVILSSMALSIMGQMLTMVFFYWIAPYFGFNVSFWTCLFCVPLGFIVMAIPISPAGIGVGQLAFYKLFDALEPGAGDAGALAITSFQAFQLIWGVIGAYVYIRYKHKPPENI